MSVLVLYKCNIVIFVYKRRKGVRYMTSGDSMFMQRCKDLSEGCKEVVESISVITGDWFLKKGCDRYTETGMCRHICNWHELMGDFVQTTGQRNHMICPKCKRDTEWVTVGLYKSKVNLPEDINVHTKKLLNNKPES